MKKQEKEIATNVSSGAEKVETIEKEVKKELFYARRKKIKRNKSFVFI